MHDDPPRSWYAVGSATSLNVLLGKVVKSHVKKRARNYGKCRFSLRFSALIDCAFQAAGWTKVQLSPRRLLRHKRLTAVSSRRTPTWGMSPMNGLLRKCRSPRVRLVAAVVVLLAIGSSASGEDLKKSGTVRIEQV